MRRRRRGLRPLSTRLQVLAPRNYSLKLTVIGPLIYLITYIYYNGIRVQYKVFRFQRTHT